MKLTMSALYTPINVEVSVVFTEQNKMNNKKYVFPEQSR